jgi:hypothetical protein
MEKITITARKNIIQTTTNITIEAISKAIPKDLLSRSLSELIKIMAAITPIIWPRPGNIDDITVKKTFIPLLNRLLFSYLLKALTISSLLIISSLTISPEAVSETTGLDIDGDHRLIGIMKELAQVKKEYERVEYALHEVKVKGYGIVTPRMEELTLDEPEIIKQGGRFGVKLRASAPSVHMIRADIETEVAPLVGTERQSEELVSYLLKEFENEPGKIWQSNIFGKSLHELVTEGLYNKLQRMPEDAQMKLQETLTRIINEGSGGLICIIL